MLHKDPFLVRPGTFELIQQLQSLSEMSDFHLVGGTALALQIGHRSSIDIDLFSQKEFTASDLYLLLKDKFTFTATLERDNTVLANINNVKTDFIRHNFPFINPPIHEEGIRFLSLEDIAAMKIHAIIQSGKRLKLPSPLAFTKMKKRILKAASTPDKVFT